MDRNHSSRGSASEWPRSNSLATEKMDKCYLTLILVFLVAYTQCIQGCGLQRDLCLWNLFGFTRTNSTGSFSNIISAEVVYLTINRESIVPAPASWKGTHSFKWLGCSRFSYHFFYASFIIITQHHCYKHSSLLCLALAWFFMLCCFFESLSADL